MSNIQWAKLKAQNRVKDIEVSWTLEEDLAIRDQGVNPEDIRSGKWKPQKGPKVNGGDSKGDEKSADADKAPSEDSKPAEDLLKMKKEDLIAKAVELGIEVPPDATKAEVVELINSAKKPE